MPGIDVDAVLIAIRMASYGTNMDVDTNCPNCQAENNNEVDLTTVLTGITVPDFTSTVAIDGLKIKLKPQLFIGINRQNLITFEEQKIMNSLTNMDDNPEVKAAAIQTSMDKLIDLGIDIVADSTEYVELDDGVRVTERAFIVEFYKNANGAIMRSVQDTLAEINKDSAIKAQKTQCTSCQTEYQVPLNFDYASFFAIGS
jgi:hypothetical protein